MIALRNADIIPTTTTIRQRNGEHVGVSSTMFAIDGTWHVPVIDEHGKGRMVSIAEVGEIDPRFGHFVSEGDKIVVDAEVYVVGTGTALEFVAYLD